MIILITRYFLSPWYIKLIIFYTMALAININLSTAYCADDTITENNVNTPTKSNSEQQYASIIGMCMFITSISLVLIYQHGDLHFLQTFMENHFNKNNNRMESALKIIKRLNQTIDILTSTDDK